MLTQLLWDVVLQVRGHEELEALVVNRLRVGKKHEDRVLKMGYNTNVQAQTEDEVSV